MTNVVLPPTTGDTSEDYWRYDITQAVNRGIGEGGGSASDNSVVHDDNTGEITAGETFIGYTWRYLDVAYGTSSSGANFTHDITMLPAGTTEFWQGRRNQTTSGQTNTPANFTWVRIEGASSSTRAYYRLTGGRAIDWVFDTSLPTGYVQENGSVIDLDALPVAQDGAQGRYEVKLFKRSSTALTTAPTDVIWTPPNTISGDNSENWSLTIPSGTDQLYEVFNTFDPANDTDIRVWSVPFPVAAQGPAGPKGDTGEMGANGANGSDGYTSSTITIFIRSATSPETPSDSTYSIDSDSFNVPTNWSRSIPSGVNPVYASSATFSTQDDTVTLDWGTPVEVFRNGEKGDTGAAGSDGDTGATGPRTAGGIVWLSATQSSAPDTPSADTWSFGSGTFSNLSSGWGLTQPAADTTNSANLAWSSSFFVVEDVFGGVQTITFQTPEGTQLFGSDIQSDNYVAGTSGWKIDRESGSAEFQNVTARGAITATSLTITDDATVNGTISANNLELDGQTITVNAQGQLSVNQGDLLSELLNAPANLGNINLAGVSPYTRTFNNNITINNITLSGAEDITVTSNDGNIIVTGDIRILGVGDVRLNAPNGCIVFNGALSIPGVGEYIPSSSSGNVCAV